MRRISAAAAAVALFAVGLGTAPSARGAVNTTNADAAPVAIGEYTPSAGVIDILRARWYDQLKAKHGDGAWAPMRMELGDADLALLGLPGQDALLRQRYPVPTSFDANGQPSQQTVDARLVTFAGTGFFGIRPGAWLLLLNDGIGWCSMAHVYGSPGNYQVSTAGHCGKVGDIATVIGVVGSRTPVLMDFGKFSKSTGDGGIGKDWALIDVYPQYQHLVSPTMAFWGGPTGMYTKTGDVASASIPRRGWVPEVKVNPDPALAQQIVHYGHGLGTGPGGTPRSGTAIVWRTSYYAFFGAISLGDSGSGSNTVTGDTFGALREAAGINTHIYVDPHLKTGLGLMAGTRATQVTATLANGQLVPYPVPAPGLP